MKFTLDDYDTDNIEVLRDINHSLRMQNKALRQQLQAQKEHADEMFDAVCQILPDPRVDYLDDRVVDR